MQDQEYAIERRGGKDLNHSVGRKIVKRDLRPKPDRKPEKECLVAVPHPDEKCKRSRQEEEVIEYATVEALPHAHKIARQVQALFVTDSSVVAHMKIRVFFNLTKSFWIEPLVDCALALSVNQLIL